MIDIDTERLESVIEELREVLGDGLIATDIWDRSTGLALASYASHPAVSALLNQITTEMVETLHRADLPGLNRYYLLDLEDDTTAVVIQHGTDILQSLILDATRTNQGVVFAMVMPTALDGVAAARA